MKRVCDINWNDPKYIRAGIIPIIYQNGIYFFGFGLENVIGSIGDFGGHIEETDRDALDAAIREYREESLNVFGTITRDSVNKCFVLDGDDTADILLFIDGPCYKYTESFDKIVRDNKEHEVQSVIWLSTKQLLIAIDNEHEEFAGTKIYPMYYRIRNTILKNRDIIYNNYIAINKC